MVNINTVSEYLSYQNLDVDTRIAVDIAFKAARKALLDNGIQELANDDRAEELVAAIAHYVRRSKF